MDASVATLRALAAECEADITLLRSRTEPTGAVRCSDEIVAWDVAHACMLQVADWLVRARLADDDFIDLRVAVVGNVDAGKSTMLGVLTHGDLDDGRGKSRSKIFRHKHEVHTRRQHLLPCRMSVVAARHWAHELHFDRHPRLQQHWADCEQAWSRRLAGLAADMLGGVQGTTRAVICQISSHKACR